MYNLEHLDGNQVNQVNLCQQQAEHLQLMNETQFEIIIFYNSLQAWIDTYMYYILINDTICSTIVKYAQEVARQQEEIDEVRRDEQLVLPDDLDYLR